MIVSLCREEDKEVAKDVLAILEMSVSSYQRSGNPELLTHIESLSNWYDTIMEKIRHGDYTEDDARRERVEKRLRGIWQ